MQIVRSSGLIPYCFMYWFSYVLYFSYLVLNSLFSCQAVFIKTYLISTCKRVVVGVRGGEGQGKSGADSGASS